MESAGTTMWMVRAGQDGHVLQNFLCESIAYLGWGDTGDVYPETTMEELVPRVERSNPAMNPRAVGQTARMIWEFCCAVSVADAIVTYEPKTRQYHLDSCSVTRNARMSNGVRGAIGMNSQSQGMFVR
jgi:predicted Mrr-cat superfamily restriction endonuclease